MKNIAVKYGLFAGLATILYFLGFYYWDKAVMLEPWVSWSSVLFIVVAMVMAIHATRRQAGQKIEFRQALRAAFLTGVIANVAFYVFYYLIMQSDAELVSILKQQTMDFYQSWTSGEQLETMMKSLEDFKVGLSTILLSLARSIIGSFILALLLAAILRRQY